MTESKVPNWFRTIRVVVVASSSKTVLKTKSLTDGKTGGLSYEEVQDQLDMARAVRLRNEYGRVRWLLSWYPQEDGFWLARLSCDRYPETVEALGQSRYLAIDSATRHLLSILHREAQSETDLCENG